MHWSVCVVLIQSADWVKPGYQQISKLISVLTEKHVDLLVLSYCALIALAISFFLITNRAVQS